MVKVIYENEATIEEEDLNLTLLEMSLKHGIKHAHICGGKARCSTCRVIILENPNNLLPRNSVETSLAKTKGFECNIRLACQSKIKGEVKLRRLVLDDHDIKLAGKPSQSTGREAHMAVLFSDLRNFTAFSENQLPYDVIHFLNRYFYSMGNAILKQNGHIDKYMGDGIMALFGLSESNPETICLNAVSAALNMIDKLDSLNQYAGKDCEQKFKMGIGIHFGEMIIGDVGHPDKIQFTAIGDTVNMASRIESATKDAQASILISEKAYCHIKDKIRTGKVIETELKGKEGLHKLHEVKGIL